MSLIYAIIARGTDIVLVDFEAIPSNFPKLAKTLLGKIKNNNRQTYLYNQSYHFHYINEQEITYLCLTDRIFPKRTAFAFLEDIKQMFCDRFDSNQRANAINYGMAQTFSENLKARMFKEYYNRDPENEKIQRLQNNLSDVKDQMIENIDKILDREEQIQILVQSTPAMKNYAGAYQNASLAVRRDQERRSFKFKLLIAVILGTLIVIGVLLYKQ